MLLDLFVVFICSVFVVQKLCWSFFFWLVSSIQSSSVVQSFFFVVKFTKILSCILSYIMVQKQLFIQPYIEGAMQPYVAMQPYNRATPCQTHVQILNNNNCWLQGCIDLFKVAHNYVMENFLDITKDNGSEFLQLSQEELTKLLSSGWLALLQTLGFVLPHFVCFVQQCSLVVCVFAFL